jgi:glycogen debranching enzyme
VRDFQRSNDYINGLEQTKVYLNENLKIEQSICIRLTSPKSPDYTGFHTIEFTDEFRPGSIIVLQISLLPQIRQSGINLRQLLNQFSNPTSQFNKIVKELILIDLERVLYRSSVEEQTDGKGFDVYKISDYGILHYCGLQGQMSVLEKVRRQNELRHLSVINLKQGNWLMDYISNRLKSHPNTKQLGDWYTNAFGYISSLSPVIVATYFDLILTSSYPILLEHSWSLMNLFINQSSTFVRALAQSTIQLISIVPMHVYRNYQQIYVNHDHLKVLGLLSNSFRFILNLDKQPRSIRVSNHTEDNEENREEDRKEVVVKDSTTT